MKALFFHICICAVSLSALFSCQNTHREKEPVIRPQYAKLFSYTQKDTYTCINVYLPQDTTTIYRTYLLYKDTAPKHTGKDTIAVKIPLKNIGCAHSPHVGFVHALGAADDIKSVGAINLLEKKSVLASRTDLGEFFNGWTFDIESLLTLSPEGVFFTPYGNEDIASLEKSVKTPILLDMSAWENHPLARSEWIKFTGFFLDKEEVADSIFREIEKSYTIIKEKAAVLPAHPIIISGFPYEGIWYIPAGGSYKGHLFKDASMTYPWAEDTHTGSLTVDFEEILSRGADADAWFLEAGLNTVPTRSSMLKQNPLYENFRTFRNGSIFICDTDEVPFFEHGILHPHYILEDYVHMSRGDKDYEPHYYRPIKDE